MDLVRAALLVSVALLDASPPALAHIVVVWASGGYDGSGGGIFGQRYDAEGSPDGPEFVVNSYTTGSPVFAVVASSRTGFVVAWQSAQQDGSGDGILAQRHRGDLIFVDGFE